MEAEASIVDLMLRRYGLRVGPAMAKYLLSHLEQARGGKGDGAVPVIGGDARTGVPRRVLISSTELLDATRPAATPPAAQHLQPPQQGELFA